MTVILHAIHGLLWNNGGKCLLLSTILNYIYLRAGGSFLIKISNSKIS